MRVSLIEGGKVAHSLGSSGSFSQSPFYDGVLGFFKMANEHVVVMGEPRCHCRGVTPNRLEINRPAISHRSWPCFFPKAR